MHIKGLVDEDFVNYKVPSMFIITSKCSFKCDIENGTKCCQNSELVNMPTHEIDNNLIIKRYIDNPITKAIVFGGLEPFDTYGELSYFVSMLNSYQVTDDLVIYTGYKEEEKSSEVLYLHDMCINQRNLIIKYGRYKPHRKKVFNSLLGVYLASDNQYAILYPSINGGNTI